MFLLASWPSSAFSLLHHMLRHGSVMLSNWDLVRFILLIEAYQIFSVEALGFL